MMSAMPALPPPRRHAAPIDILAEATAVDLDGLAEDLMGGLYDLPTEEVDASLRRLTPTPPASRTRTR
jgi:hypothetical protein